jgi:hypothetical protein
MMKMQRAGRVEEASTGLVTDLAGLESRTGRDVYSREETAQGEVSVLCI